jgi:hypothetical protein
MGKLQTLVLCMLVTLSDALSATPLEFDAHYTAKAMGLTATAHRSSTQTSTGTYRLQNSLQLTVMSFSVGSIVETSEFSLQQNQLHPLKYEYVQSGVSSTDERISFDWETGVALSVVEEEAFQIPLSAPVLDKLNFSVQLGEDIARENQNEFRYLIVDGDKVEEHLYRISAKEIIVTPAGTLDTVKLERVRDSNSKRKTTIWLAKDWQYLLVKLEQVSSSGTVTEILLESAKIDGNTIK